MMDALIDRFRLVQIINEKGITFKREQGEGNGLHIPILFALVAMRQ
jgi:hypothetical protein